MLNPSPNTSSYRTPRRSQPVALSSLRGHLGRDAATAPMPSSAPRARRSGAVMLRSLYRRSRTEDRATSATPIPEAFTSAANAVVLNAGDVPKVEAAMKVLLSLAEASDVDGWRREVNQALRCLTGADVASFALPVGPLGGRDPWVSDLPALHSRPAGADLDLEWLQEGAGQAAVAMRLDLPEGTAWHWLHFTTPRTEEELERVARLLRMVLPAFRAGIESWRRVIEHGRALRATLDVLREPAMLVAVDGRVRHVNPPAARLLEAEASRGYLSAAAARVARQALTGTEPVAAATVEMPSGGRYVIEATPADGGMGRDASALVTLRVAGAAALDDETLRARFGLTPREVEVARLVAAGLTNREVAARLGIREPTTRHHVEKVMGKLGVNARAKVGALLRG